MGEETMSSDGTDKPVVMLGETYLHERHGQVIVVEIYERHDVATADEILESTLSVKIDKCNEDTTHEALWPRPISVDRFLEEVEDE